MINGEEKEDGSDKLRKYALDNLEKASADSVLGQVSLCVAVWTAVFDLSVFSSGWCFCHALSLQGLLLRILRVKNNFVIYCRYFLYNLLFVVSQGLKVIDKNVENLASGAWQSLGSAWQGGSNLVQK